MCFDAKLYLEKDKCNVWVINIFLDNKIAKNVPTSRVLTSILATIPANYRLSSQFLSVGLKVGVRVWFKVSVRFGIINNTKNVRFGFSLSWFIGPCCVCQISKILDYVILYCGRLLIGIFHIPKFSRYVRKLTILLPKRTFFVLLIIPNRTLTLNQTRTPTFKPTDKNWDDKR
jgi:hypothetical protein